MVNYCFKLVSLFINILINKYLLICIYIISLIIVTIILFINNSLCDA